MHIVVLSGAVASGKTSLAQALAESAGGEILSTREVIGRLTGKADSRGDLQAAGRHLDSSQGGDWVAEALGDFLNNSSGHDVVIVDAVRTVQQIEALRRDYGRRVVHIHLEAEENDLRSRFEQRNSGLKESTFEDARTHDTEYRVGELRDRADGVIDTSRSDVEQALTRCRATLGLLPTPRQYVDLLVGGQYGSEGKGNVAFHLGPEYEALVRAGGPNAGHKVPLPDGVFTHQQLPSGTRANEDALLLIAPGAVIDVDILLQEIDACGVDHRVCIDPAATIITDEDKEREKPGKDEIGSTGSGSGAAIARRILGRLTGEDTPLAGSDDRLAKYIWPTSDALAEVAGSGGMVFVEGTQGSALSIHHGPYPHVTSRDTNAGGLLAEVGLPPSAVRKTVMVCRTYPIRVQGESGPLLDEIDWETVASRSGLNVEDVRGTEHSSVSRKLRRVGEFDWKLLRRSSELNQPTDVALTFVDYLAASNRNAFRFDQLTPETLDMIRAVEEVTQARVSLVSVGFGHGREIIDRRVWRGDR